jgi:hypothetical protein
LNSFRIISPHRDADDIAPLAGVVVALAVAGLVFPKRALAGWQGLRDGMFGFKHLW